jgi:hypothetical protein
VHKIKTFWVVKHEPEASALSKEAIQRQLIKADETSQVT